jgi:hypothetical protein
MPAERQYTSVLVVSSRKERGKTEKKERDLSAGFFFFKIGSGANR